MDNEEIKKAIAQRFDNLQPEIQDIIMSQDYERSLVEIIGDFDLNPEQMKELEFNTTMVLLGEIHPDEYKRAMQESMNVSENILEKIVASVEQKIFKSVRSMIVENWEKDDREESAFNAIPIPPYAKEDSTQKNTENRAESTPTDPKDKDAQEKEVFNETGIQMVEKNILVEPKNSIENTFSIEEDKTLVDSGISLVEEETPVEKEHLIPSQNTQKSVLQGLENPPEGKSSMVNDKLNNSMTQVQNASNQTEASNTKDPYREQIG